MKKYAGYLVAGAFGVALLGGAVAAGYAEEAIGPRSPERAILGKSVSERQMLERRRGRMAEVAIVGTTVQ